MSASDGSGESVEINTLNKLVGMITSVQDGLDPDVIANWYRVVESEAKSRCPTEELQDSIEVVQNPALPMKFEFKSSKRAIPYVVAAIENSLGEMPFATRLYFEKFEEIMQQSYGEYISKSM
ncbi:MAG: hypothetical protein JRN20_06470 [Nitrososphaerota archaeon]|nr:hypothetical protein [Nitrososphaerota archaeon]